MPRSLCQITDFTASEVYQIVELAREMKSGKIKPRPLEGKSVACIFTKPSLRTRVSFETGINDLGGHAIYITDNEIQLGRRESVADAARVLSRYVGLIMIRTFEQSDVVELSRNASVPVVNGLTDLVHPCQIRGDYLTVFEHLDKKEHLKIAYLGDSNNVTNSWFNLASLIPMDLRIGTAEGSEPDNELLERARKNPDSSVLITNDPKEAVADADVLYTDVWASMGQKHLVEEKRQKLQGFQINSSLLSGADPKAIVMHC